MTKDVPSMHPASMACSSRARSCKMWHGPCLDQTAKYSCNEDWKGRQRTFSSHPCDVISTSMESLKYHSIRVAPNHPFLMSSSLFWVLATCKRGAHLLQNYVCALHGTLFFSLTPICLNLVMAPPWKVRSSWWILQVILSLKFFRKRGELVTKGFRRQRSSLSWLVRYYGQ